MAEITLKEYLEKNGDRRVDEAALEALLNPISRVWKPKRNDKYWAINEFGTASDFFWADDDSDSRAYAIGGCFPTREAAEFEAERRKVNAELQRLAEEAGGVDWLNDTQKVCIDYDRKNDFFSVSHRATSRIQGAIYFPSDEAARAAIVAVGEARLKTYLFNVTV